MSSNHRITRQTPGWAGYINDHRRHHDPFSSRVKHESGLNLSHHQAVSVPANQQVLNEIIPSVSQPTFGGYFVIDYKTKGVELKNATLQFNVSALTDGGSTILSSKSSPSFLPFYFAIQKLEIVINNQVLDTLYANQLFLLNQVLFSDDERLIMNNLVGNYASTPQQQYLASQTSDYFIELRTIFSQAHVSLLSNSHEIQLRVYMNTLAQSISYNGYNFTNAPTANINYCNLITEIIKLEHSHSTKRSNEMIKTPEHHIFHDLRPMYININAGVNETRSVLTGVVGKIAVLIFVVRPTSNLFNDGCYRYLKIQNYEVLDKGQTNIVGGQRITDANQRALFKHWSKSSYTNESFGFANLVGNIEDNGANIYMWSFSPDPVMSLKKGLCLGSHEFSGNESLVINYGTTLLTNVQIDVYSFGEQILHQSHHEVRKVAL